MENSFDGFISRVDQVEERISELEAVTIETSKTIKQTNKQKD